MRFYFLTAVKASWLVSCLVTPCGLSKYIYERFSSERVGSMFLLNVGIYSQSHSITTQQISSTFLALL
jgi:hypothetical protein